MCEIHYYKHVSEQNWKIHVLSWCFLAWLVLNIPFMCNNNKNHGHWNQYTVYAMLLPSLVLWKIWVYNMTPWKTAAKETHTALILTHFEMVLLNAYVNTYITMCICMQHMYNVHMYPSRFINSCFFPNLPISFPNHFVGQIKLIQVLQLRHADTAIKGIVSRDFKWDRNYTSYGCFFM